MNYEQAKALMIAHAPSLIIDASTNDANHINVRRSVDGAHFSIGLPNIRLPPAIEGSPAVAAVHATGPVFDDDGRIIKPAVEGSPGMPAVEGRTSEAQRDDSEREAFLEALRYAEAHLPDPAADVPPGSERAE